MNTLNPSIRYHLWVGLSISLWGFLFSYFVRPFNDETTGQFFWVVASIGFNVISFLAYTVVAVVQNKLYQKIHKWSIGYELGALVFYHILYTLGTYVFYKSPPINGGLNFLDFNTTITLRLALVVLPIVAIARRYLIKLLPIKEDILTIKGDNKLDILKIRKSELICVSNAQNYVEIFYTQNNKLHSKLIRTSLKSLKEDFEFLLQIHRSHLINPIHFKSWKDQNTILLTEMELPVSKTYKKDLLVL
ncbi:MAG: LytTR family transcriptional regulator [Schleiferiaceae bacterium]|jgi:hypothetical protein|nr:LytTR family transcriptional regulator [Schleiferiaceae bacterium]